MREITKHEIDVLLDQGKKTIEVIEQVLPGFGTFMDDPNNAEIREQIAGAGMSEFKATVLLYSQALGVSTEDLIAQHTVWAFAGLVAYYIGAREGAWKTPAGTTVH